MAPNNFHVLVIGGGSTGAALAHDLALRGLRVTLVERGELTSGTAGRHHGLLHSGGRYAVKDQESARECIEENRILRRIAPGSFEENDGLFVAISEADVAYQAPFLQGCAECGIPTRVLSRADALCCEPYLNPAVKLAVQVPDATLDCWRLPLRFFATAKHNGADIRPYQEVTGIVRRGDTVTGVCLKSHLDGHQYELGADIVVNATGAWAEQVSELAGVRVPVRPSPGVMVAVRGRWCNMVLNRLAPSGDGDIIVPQRSLSVIGTTSWYTEDPDRLGLPEEHVQKMYAKGAELIPALQTAPLRAAWAAARPLIGEETLAGGRELSRTFKAYDHKLRDGVEGIVTISGGKGTTMRGMAELTANLVCQKLGIAAPCRTREVVLLPYWAYYQG
ncbi:MAG TPA: FAD-dependent oxidoreductase [Chloroflexota bacterium]|nr:FAD-dependent oxidoreductase [Chloroflexota bacterium]